MVIVGRVWANSSARTIDLGRAVQLQTKIKGEKYLQKRYGVAV